MNASIREIHVPLEPASPGGVSPSIGQLIRSTRPISEEKIDQILAYQREKGVRFGEAGVALRIVDRLEVVQALAKQFHYPLTSGRERTHSDELLMVTDPFGEEAEAFRELRSQLLLEIPTEEPRRAIAVLSPDVGDGKSFIAANLAVAFSQLGARTLLIDADLRAPRQDKLLGVDAPEGLSGVLSERSHSNVVHRVAHLPHLYLLAAGPVPPNPLELLQRSAFASLVQEMLTNFEHVVIDTPAGVRGADARLIASRAGAVLMVGRKGRSRIASLQSMLRSLSRARTNVAGIVMNEH